MKANDNLQTTRLNTMETVHDIFKAILGVMQRNSPKNNVIAN